MAQEVLQQISQRLQESERPLIVFPWTGGHKESGDAVGSALAMYQYLQKLGKRAEIISPGFAPGRLAFLPHVNEIRPELNAARRYTVRIRTEHTPVSEWSYGLKEGALEFYITPTQGVLRQEDIELTEERYGYDTIIALDTPDLHALGKIFETHAELFYKTPIINIDHHPENEQYGQINLIDINASATGEILAEMFKKMGSPHLDDKIATNLFAAIFLKTGGFKHPAITPNTLKLAAELIQLGARREEIMKNVFRARSLASLRLWGKALAHLKHNPNTHLTWTTLTMREILESGGDVRELPEVIEELIFTAPEASLVALLYEEAEHRICVMLASKKTGFKVPHALPWDMLETGPGLTRYCILGHDLVSAEREVVDKLQGMLKLLPRS